MRILGDFCGLMVYLILRKSGKNQVQTKARERELQEDLMKAKSVTNIQCFPQYIPIATGTNIRTHCILCILHNLFPDCHIHVNVSSMCRVTWFYILSVKDNACIW